MGHPRRFHYLTNMRGLAIVYIVAVHCVDLFVWIPDSYTPYLFPIFIDVSVMFVFLAGFLFEHTCAKQDDLHLAVSRIANVIVPYVVASIPAIMIYIEGLKAHPYLPESFFLQGEALQIVGFLLTGSHLGPLWFIPTIVVLYAVSPVLRRLVHSPIGLLALGALFGAALVLGRPVNNFGPLQLAVHFAPVYGLGMVFARNRPAVNRVLQPRTRMLVVAAAAAACLSILLPALGQPTPHVALKTVLCVATYGLFASYLDRKVEWLQFLARYAFAIFLIHGYLVGAGRMLADRWPLVGSLSGLLLSVTIVIAVSILAARATQSLFGLRSRYVLGV